MPDQFIPAARKWLQDHTGLAKAQRDALARLAPVLVGELAESRARVIGLGGAPGTGKSTLARMLTALLVEAGTPAFYLSLDDYYLPRAQRHRLADKVHPLFAVRGVPGTHDIVLLAKHVTALMRGETSGLEFPRFDKALDDRTTSVRRYPGSNAPRCLFVEGWLVGTPPQSPQSLEPPCNRLERERDAAGTWRSGVNRQLEIYQDMLGTRLDLRWVLRAPDWASIVAWRWRQERDILASRRGVHSLGSKTAVRSFLATFERLCRHIQEGCIGWADRVIQLDRDHRPVTW